MFRLLGRLFSSSTHRRRVWIALASATVALLPGVGALGYESALALAPVLTLLTAMVAVDAVRRHRAEQPTAPSSALSDARRELMRSIGIETAILHAIAIGVLITAGLFYSDDVRRGLPFYLLGPGMSSALGALVGLWAGALFTSRALQITACWIPLIASIAIGVWRLYHHPVVFAFDPFWGYFAGPIYDNDVVVTSTYVFYRAYNLLAGLVAVVLWCGFVDPARLTIDLARARGFRPISVAAFLVLVVTVGVVAFNRDRAGFHASVRTLTTVLHATHRTAHFVIHFDPEADHAQEIQALALEHEFAWRRLERILGVTPEAPVHSFVFETAKQKRKLLGAGRTEVAAPWRRHIYLTSSPFPPTVLHHELAHVFGARFGDRLLGVSLRFPKLNMGLIEGFAVALEDRVQESLGCHERAAVLQRLERLPSLNAIMGLGFLAQSPQRAYTAAGSFCRWLLEKYDLSALTELYGNAGDFESTLGRSLGELEAEWIEFLLTVEVRDSDLELWQRTFDRRSIFERRHAHEIATLLREIELDETLGRFESVVTKRSRIARLEPERARHRIDLAHAYGRSGRFEEAERRLEELRRDPDLDRRERSEVAERLGDISLHRGDLGSAADSYDRALSSPMTISRRRSLQLKRLAAEDATLAPLVEDLFATFSAPPPEEIEPLYRSMQASKIAMLPGHAALGAYLGGRAELAGHDAPSAAVEFRRALGSLPDGSTLPHPEFVRAARLNLMNACCQIGEFLEARELWTLLVADPTLRPGDRAELDRWRARIDFFESAGTTLDVRSTAPVEANRGR